jgi:ribosomal protein S1
MDTEKNNWNEIKGRYKVGMQVEGKISLVKQYGIFLDLDHGGTGHLETMRIDDNPILTKDYETRFLVGQRMNAVVIWLDDSHEKIKLSLRKSDFPG